MELRRTFAAALACFLMALVLAATPPGRALEDNLYAALMSWTPRPPAHPRVLIAAKDDASWAAPPDGHWGRHVHARAILGAAEAGATSFGVDFVLDEPRPEDDEMRAALRTGAPVVAAAEEQRGRSLVAAEGDLRVRDVARERGAYLAISGPHAGFMPWITRGFINMIRSGALKQPVRAVELYRPGDPPRPGFAFALFLETLAADAWSTVRHRHPPPDPGAPLAAWKTWLHEFVSAEEAGPSPRFPDPAMERLLWRAEIRALLRGHGEPHPEELLERLEPLVERPLLPIQLPGPPPTERVHRVDFAGRARTFPALSLRRLAEPEELALLLGSAEVLLDPRERPRVEFPPPAPPGEVHTLTGVVRGRLDRSTRVLAVERTSGRLAEAKADATGAFRLEGLPAGTVDLYLTTPLDEAGTLALTATREAVPVPGPALALKLPPPGGELLLRAPAGARVSLTASGLDGEWGGPVGVQGQVTATAQGAALVTGLPAGEYAAVVIDPEAPAGPPGFLVVPARGSVGASPPPRPVAGRVPGPRVPEDLEVVAQELATGTRHPAREGEYPDGLPAGRYLVLAEPEGPAPRAWLPGRDRLRDRVVLLGTVMETDQDAFPTPVDFGRTGDVPGVEIHANVVSNLLSARQLRPLPPARDVPLGLAVVLACATLCLLLSPILAVLLGCLLLALYLALAGWLLSGPGVIVTTAPPLVGGGAFLTYQLVVFLRGARREARHVREVFGKCVDPVLRDRLLETPHLVLEGEERVVTVLFSDVRGFTTLSEVLSPEDLLECLNSYLGRVTPVFLQHGGVFDKFIGDAFMGFFGAPLDQPDHADRALRAARAMLDEQLRWKAAREEEGLPAFDVGFGINSGLAVAGAIGSQESRVNYSVLGDAVNVAARLESLCKEHRATILTSAHTLQLCQETHDCVDLGEIVVKGRREPVRVIKLHPLEEEDDVESTRGWSTDEVAAALLESMSGSRQGLKG